MADEYLFTNNANSTLAGGITAGAVQLTVASGDGALFPAPGALQRAALTIVDTVLGTLEVVELTARAGDLMTIVRAQEGTTALAFSAGATVSHRVTAGTLDWLKSLSDPVPILQNPDAATNQTITPGALGDIPLTIKGVASQSANLQEWHNNAAAVLAYVDPTGAITSVEPIQGQRLKSTHIGSEAVPSVGVGGTLHGFRNVGGRFAAVVDNADAAVFEPETQIVGSLDNLSLVTKRLGDLLYFPLAGGSLAGPFELEYASPTFDLVDTAPPAFSGHNRIRMAYGSEDFTIELRNNAETLIGNLINIPITVAGATAIEFNIASTLAAAVAASGTSSPAVTTIITREKGDARYAGIAHETNTTNPHAVTALQVTATGTWATVQAALTALDATYTNTVFGRSGTVIAVDGDYDAFYVNLGGATMTGALVINDGGGANITISESGIDKVSGGTEIYDFTNTGAGDMELRIDGDPVVTRGATETLTSKTLTAPTLTSPVSTGIPTVPTAAPATSTTQAASTAFVGAAIAAIPAGSSVDKQTFNADGTWTKPAGAIMVFVEGVGSGGSGARDSSASLAGGGGGGSFASAWFDAADLGATETVTVEGGGGFKSIDGNGNSGADTTFGAFLTAYGGQGGRDTTGAGGKSGLRNAGFGIDLQVWGGDGGLGGVTPDPGQDSVYGGAGGGGADTSDPGGAGGTSVHAGDGGLGAGNTTVAGDGVQPGGGGGGSEDGNSGSGADGRITVWTIIAT